MKRRPREELLELTKPHTSQFPIVEGTMCIEVRVPAHIAYVALLQGFVAQMTNHWSYQGNLADRKEVATLVNQAYTETEWQSCMNCEELTACIQPLLDAQSAQIINNILNQSQYGTTTPGIPMTGEQKGANLAEGTNPSCDKDILWAQSLALVQYTNAAIVDVMQKIEAATNTVELAGLIDAIPILGFIAKALGTEAVTDTTNYFQEAFQEEYEAQYTTEVENALACQIFCACQEDCRITIDRINAIMQSNVSSIIPDSPTDLLNLIETIAGVNFDTTQVVDVCFFFAWQAGALGNFFFGKNFDRAIFGTLLGLAVNDANNDWILLCDCPGCLKWDRENPADWTFTDEGEAPAGPGWRYALAGDDMIGQITGLALTGYSQATFEWNLFPSDVVGYDYIRVITDGGTYSYSGPFTGPINHQQAIIEIPSSETVETVEYHITGEFAATGYELNFVELCE